MLGNITEKQPSKKVAPISIGNIGGFPPVLRATTARRPVNKADITQGNIVSVEAVGKSQEPTHQSMRSASINHGKSDPADESSEINKNMIEAMSPSEITLALDEIRSLLSPKSIEFLQRGSAPSEARNAPTTTVQHKNSSVADLAPTVPLVPTSDNPWHEDVNPSEAAVRSVNSAVSAENPLTDRYDLNGRKVVDPEVAGTRIREEVRKSGLFGSSKSLADEVGDVIAGLCVEHLLPVAKGAGHPEAFFVWRQDALASAQQQPQDELKHHQFQHDSPGYTLREIIEMFRSEFAAQRIVAMRMLSGVLLRRECAVSLEAYSQAFAHNAGGSDGGHSELRGIEDEVGRESSLFADLSACFEALMAKVTSKLSTSTSGIDLVLSDSLSAAAPPSLSEEHRLQLRKLLCWSCMHMLCAPDLPVELPTLLLWALGTNINVSSEDGDAGDLHLAPSFGHAAPRNNPAVAKLGLLRCLHMYLRSPAEEASVDWLRCRSSLWAAYGTPRLSTPHTRRPGSAYEQDMAECLERSSKFLAEEDDELQDEDDEQQQTKPRTPESVAEAFALQCRWSRVSAIVSRGSVVASLANHAVTAVENLVNATTGSASSSSSEIVTALGMSSLRLLALIARQGGDDILSILHRQFLRPSWRFFVSMCESDRTEADFALKDICRQWWNVLAELVLRDHAVAAFLFETHGEWLGPVVLRLLLRKAPCAPPSASGGDGNPPETIDGVVGRVLQSCLTYGFGFACVTELLMADQVASTELPSHSSSCLLPQFSVRLLLLLEQAAVSAGAALGSYVAGLSTTSQVPFALPKAVSEAVQVSSSVFSFVKRNWSELQRVVLARTLSVEWSTAILSLLCAVFARAQDDQLLSNLVPADAVSACRFKMAEAIVVGGGLRGQGLVFTAISFNAHLLAEEQQKVGGSVTAAVLHLSGQGRDLARFAATQDLFCHEIVADLITAHASSRREGVHGSTAWLQGQELALALYLHLNVAAEIGCGGEDRGNVLLQSYAASAVVCCDMLAILRPPLDRGEEPNGDGERLIRGSVAEGILLWHSQRVQQAGIVAQTTGLASLLLRSPGNEALSRTLDSILATQLPKLTANSHCDVLVGFTRHYLRRLIFACHTSEHLNNTAQYGEIEAKYAPFADTIVNKAFRCDVGLIGTGGSGALSGTAPYSRAGEWLALRGPGGTPIALKPNWAFEVLMGDLGGENLADWLQVLLAQVTNQSQNRNQSQSVGGPDESLLASQIYTLLKLTAPDQAPKWTNFNSSQAGLAEGTAGEVNERAVFAYRLLLTHLLKCIGNHSPSFTATFCRVVSKEYFATTGVMSSHRHRMRAAKSGPSKYVNLEGVLDLCEKALEAGLNQAIDERVHSVALIALSEPLVPWAARQRVWTQLSALRLVHLLEDRGTLLALLPLLLAHPGSTTELRGPTSTESLSLYTEIVDALRTLRSASDRTWVITSVSIIQLSQFIFCETSVVLGHRASSNAITGQRAQLLTYLLSLAEKDTEVAWIRKALFAYAASSYSVSCDERSLLLEDVVEQVCVVCGDDEAADVKNIVTTSLPIGLVVEMDDGTRKELRELIFL